MAKVGSVSRLRGGGMVGRRVLAHAFCVALAGAAVSAMSPAVARADEGAEGYVECRWQPFMDAWACALPAAFSEGRFGPPPEFKHDATSEALRQRAFDSAKATPGARARGRVGVFVPEKDGAWLFVPGSAWSPGEPVFLPPAKPASR